MTVTRTKTWRDEFGLRDRKPVAFFSSVEEIDAAGSAAPQAHALRRAFQQLDLDGILCHERTPVIYFRQVPAIEASEVAALHRRFWNQGIAPILVLIAPDQVHVYSGLASPWTVQESSGNPTCLVQQLNRTEAELRSFIVAVDSGEFFRRHAKSFDPQQRVDRDLLRNLRATRARLTEVSTVGTDSLVFDALLCRLVFTCYLFDRGIIDEEYLTSQGLRGVSHLRDILNRQPREEAKDDLYALFKQLGKDFNGDLFSDDLEAERGRISDDHLEIVDRFFHGTDVRSGQQSFWPYDFEVIPIETISAIYEHFLKAADAEAKKTAGAFYTPRFLAELVLDLTLEAEPSLLQKRYLDPACGSGIFLVGLFNRLAEAWHRLHPNARYDRRAEGLLKILRERLHGVDSNPTACRITAFSLCLAFLDQLSPPDIRELQRRGKVLPRLIYDPTESERENQGRIIRSIDFFTDAAATLTSVDYVVGNPPWTSVQQRNSPVEQWCLAREVPFPDRQLATAFVWKATEHLEQGGKVCFVLPHGTIFNHSETAVEFQQTWMRKHAVELILNLTDYQYFLFEESRAPAIVVRYRKEPPSNGGHRIDYYAPKTDWSVSQGEVLSVLPQDRSRVTVRELLDDLRGDDAPLIWKERFWATPRDRRLLGRLVLLPRLRDVVGQASRRPGKRWLIAEGFQPLGENDDPKKACEITLPARRFIEATSPDLDLLLLRRECQRLRSRTVTARGRSNRNVDIFRAPHVLVTQGFSRIAFADFDVAFRHAVRGIHGPKSDRDLLIFLTAYLRSKLARYFLFHTSSNWGVSRAKIHVEELLRIPFPLPEQTADPQASWQIVRKVARLITDAAERAKADLADRAGIVRKTQAAAEKLVEAYFDIDDVERMLIADTLNVIVPSVRPTRKRIDVPTIRPSTPAQRDEYQQLLCETLNGWASGGKSRVDGRWAASSDVGVGLVLLEKVRRGECPKHIDLPVDQVLPTLVRLQKTAAKRLGSFELVRGAKVFEENRLYLIKPLGLRFWTKTAALNDADEIAATILMRNSMEEA